MHLPTKPCPSRTRAKRSPGRYPSDGSTSRPRAPGVFRTMWLFRGVLSRLGAAAASLSAVRSARQVVLPLWGFSIGLDAQTIALVVGISGAIDFALFYASGQVMDRFGRLWAALPAMLLMGLGFIALAFTHDLDSAAMWFAMFAAVLGVGNGLSSGILLTLGADVAPRSDPAPFLGSWRTLADAGGAVSPLIVSAITAVSSLSVATGAVGVVGLLGALAFLRWVPRFVPRKGDPLRGARIFIVVLESPPCRPVIGRPCCSCSSLSTSRWGSGWVLGGVRRHARAAATLGVVTLALAAASLGVWTLYALGASHRSVSVLQLLLSPMPESLVQPAALSETAGVFAPSLWQRSS